MTAELPKKTVQISIRLPYSLKKLIARYLKLHTHVNESDFVRDAIREKISRDAPNLYHELFQGEKSNQ